MRVGHIKIQRNVFKGKSTTNEKRTIATAKETQSDGSSKEQRCRGKEHYLTRG